LKFNDIAEDVESNSRQAVELYTNGLVTLEEAREIIGLETDADIKNELEAKADNIKPVSPSGPDAAQKKEDAKFWHADNGGNQEGKKAEQKADPNVPSVN